MKAIGMHCIDHKIPAMGCVVEKFGLYNQHLQNVISITANAKAIECRGYQPSLKISLTVEGRIPVPPPPPPPDFDD